MLFISTSLPALFPYFDAIMVVWNFHVYAFSFVRSSFVLFSFLCQSFVFALFILYTNKTIFFSTFSNCKVPHIEQSLATARNDFYFRFSAKQKRRDEKKNWSVQFETNGENKNCQMSQGNSRCQQRKIIFESISNSYHHQTHTQYGHQSHNIHLIC